MDELKFGLLVEQTTFSGSDRQSDHSGSRYLIFVVINGNLRFFWNFIKDWRFYLSRLNHDIQRF